MPVQQRAILVRGFDFGTEEAAVREHCATAGKVVSVELKGKGSALVTFASEAQARQALGELNQTIIDGNTRYIDVKIKGVEQSPGIARPSQAMKLAPNSATAKKLQQNAPKAKVVASKWQQNVAKATVACVSVRGFDFETEEEAIRKHCSAAGRVLSVECKKKGDAIVTYASVVQAQKAVTTLNMTTIKGNTRYIEVKLKGNGDARQAPAGGAVAAQQTKKRKASSPGNPCRVFVRGFDHETAEEDIVGHFSSAGEILECTLQRKSALLTFSSAEEAEVATSLNGTFIPGNTRYIDVKVDEGAKEKGGSIEQPASKKQKTKSGREGTKKGPSGPDLPRDRITDEPVTGKVLHWRGKFGWIKPEIEFDHPQASKHGGKIYVHMQDVPTGELTKDDEVQFHVFADSSGLGAEDVMSVN